VLGQGCNITSPYSSTIFPSTETVTTCQGIIFPLFIRAALTASTNPAVLLAGSFGHSEDAALLEFANSHEIQAAPKVSF